MKKQVFHSKVGLEILIPLYGVLGFVMVLLALDGIWVGFGLIACMAVWLGYVLFSFRYVIEGNLLFIRGSMFYRMQVDIFSISCISKTWNPLSSPAASLDRLAIRYGHGDEILVSPKDKQGFVHALQAINPDIQVQWD